MLRVSFALSVLMVFAAIGTEPVLAQPAPQTSNEVFGNLNSLVRAIPFSRQSWEEELAELGLRGESGSGEQWTLRDGRGEVRAWAFFLDDETTFFLLFFPTDPTPIPDALLSHLLGMATRTGVDDGDTIEINLPDRTLSGDGCRGRGRDSFVVRLTGGSLMRTSAVVQCKKPSPNAPA